MALLPQPIAPSAKSNKTTADNFANAILSLQKSRSPGEFAWMAIKNPTALHSAAIRSPSPLHVSFPTYQAELFKGTKHTRRMFIWSDKQQASVGA